MRFRMPALTALLTAGILLVSGCVPTADVVVPVEPGDTQPVFASDEEALAAAVEAYESYMRVSGEIGASGGEDVERMQPLVTPDLYRSEAASFETLKESGTHQGGFARIVQDKLQQFWDEPHGTANVIAYFCVDISDVRFFDSNDNDTTNPNREDLGEVEVTLVSSASDAAQLVVAEVTPWLGSGICS